jgi:uncharacterized protein (TIGR00299 family) protein
MTIAYFDCFSGISGDMALGALLDAGGERSLLEGVVKALRLQDEVAIDVRQESRGHAGGTRVIVRTTDIASRTVPALRRLVDDADIPDEVRRPARDAIDRVARAESRIHGVGEEDLHLHELGGADTLVDIVGSLWLLHSLDVVHVYASPLPMSQPAPATLRILEDTGAVLIPTDGGRELVTPTGAAILAAAATFERPSMSLHRVGYGIGAYEAPGNALAVWIGQEAVTESAVTVIETNLDDMAPDLIAALTEDLMAAGALDVTVTPSVMKKGRPGHVLSVMSSPDLVARLSDHLLRHSTTLGLRLSPVQRVIAERRVVEVETPLGKAHVKVKELGGHAVDVSPEYEDCRRLSRESGVDLREVMRIVAEAGRRELRLD